MFIMMYAVEKSAPDGYCPTITSINDSKHMKGSLHYHDRAIDIRVRDYPGFNLFRFEQTRGAVDKWVDRMKKYLPDDYVVIWGTAGHKNHIHIQAPKNDWR